MDPRCTRAYLVSQQTAPRSHGIGGHADLDLSALRQTRYPFMGR